MFLPFFKERFSKLDATRVLEYSGRVLLKSILTKPLSTLNRKNHNKTDQFENQNQVRLRHTRLNQQKIDHKPELCFEEKFQKYAWKTAT